MSTVLNCHRGHCSCSCGSLLALTAAIAIVRFPDTLPRMHAATKPQVVGLIMVLAGAVLELRGNVDIWMLVLVGIFTLFTAPVIAHMRRTGGVPGAARSGRAVDDQRVGAARTSVTAAFAPLPHRASAVSGRAKNVA